MHCKILFHDSRRRVSAFGNSTRADVDKVCAMLLQQLATLEFIFYFGRVGRQNAPKILHVPLINSEDQSEVLDARLKLELNHLQMFAYNAAATRACHTLPKPAGRLVVDNNKSVVRWFNENRQASRLLDLLFFDAALPSWPTITIADDNEHSGLQIADLLTYFATKQFQDPRFADTFDLVRHKSQFMIYEFDPQVCRPYVPPSGVTVKPFPKRT